MAQMRPDSKLTRASIAMVWLYEGLWCKLLGGVPRHADVIAAAPFIGPGAARAALITLGLAECGIAAWVLSGQRMRQAALVQTALLVAMNAGGTCIGSKCSGGFSHIRGAGNGYHHKLCGARPFDALGRRERGRHRDLR